MKPRFFHPQKTRTEIKSRSLVLSKYMSNVHLGFHFRQIQVDRYYPQSVLPEWQALIEAER
jgi:hypothetical protein